MKVFVAGASGAVGIPIVKELIKQGHEVAAMTRSERGTQQLQTLGAKVMSIDAFDYKQVKEALQQVAPEAVIDMLTFLPKNLADMPRAFPDDRKLRLEGGGHLFAASVAGGVSRYLQQSCGFWIKPKSGERLGTEDDPFELQATPNIASGSDMYRQLEERVFSDPKIEGIALRFGFFYGPGTWYTADGNAAEMARQEHLPIIGKGSAVNSFVHVDDAAKPLSRHSRWNPVCTTSSMMIRSRSRPGCQRSQPLWVRRRHRRLARRRELLQPVQMQPSTTIT